MRRFILLLSFAFILQDSFAQVNSGLANYLDSLFKPYNNISSPGIAITILQNGRPVTKKNYGMAVIEHKVPFTHQSSVRFEYSQTREFMAVVLAMMESDGLLSFNDKVRKYFPQLPVWSEPVTIRDLLNHSSGFVDEWGTLLLTQAAMNNRLDKEQFLDLLYNQSVPQFEPGNGYMYCNSDYGLLRLIMEVASNKSLEFYMKEKLFRPLQMNATQMNDDLGKIIPGLVNRYEGKNTYRRFDKIKISPASNYRIVSTADDLEKWTIACNDKNSFVAKAFERLYKYARLIPVLKEKHYTFGIELNERNGHLVIQHNGVNKVIYIRSIPSLKLDIITISNNENLLDKAEHILDYFLPYTKEAVTDFNEVYSKPAIELNADKLNSYSGRYWVTNEGTYSSHLKHIRYYDIKTEDGRLRLYHTARDFFPLVPIADNLFKDLGYPNYFRFIQSHPDSVMKLEAVSPTFIETMERNKFDSLGVSTKYLKQFTGLYYSKHLDYYFKIELNNSNELILKRPTVSEKVLTPYGENQFIFLMESGMGEGWNVLTSFTFNHKGDVNGFSLQHIRMIHHRFEKVK
jgi:CubicO group peptidase (beta-lactamase class C family)